MYAPILIGHSATLKEKYDAIKTDKKGYILQHIKYEHQQWAVLCQFRNGELFVGSAEWVHEVSLLLWFSKLANQYPKNEMRYNTGNPKMKKELFSDTL